MNAPYRKRSRRNHSTPVRRTDEQRRAEARRVAEIGLNEHDIDPVFVVAAVAVLGTSLSELSRRHGLGRNALQQALSGTRPSRRVEMMIGRVVGINAAALWPDRYGHILDRAAKTSKEAA